jgi:ubiquinone biosynthesis protein
MTDWNLLLNEADIASVLPEAYAHYRLPIKGGLTVFLEGLPQAHQDAVLMDQAALPLTATVSERFARLARSCPALHKLGQTLARDRRLLPELRLQLQQLESLPPSISLADIRKMLVRELGRLDRLGVVVDSPALAEASVAVVVPFRRKESGETEGVFKLLKPGIEERLDEELALMERIGAYLDEECETLEIPRLDYRESFEGLAEKLRQEVRLDLEQRHLANAHTAYAREPRIQIPTLF